MNKATVDCVFEYFGLFPTLDQDGLVHYSMWPYISIEFVNGQFDEDDLVELLDRARFPREDVLAALAHCTQLPT